MPSLHQKLRHASTLADQGDLMAARGVYRDILAQYPQNRSARQALTRIAAQASDPPSAALARIAGLARAEDWSAVVTACGALAADYPQSEPLWTYFGTAAQALGQHDAALPAFLRAVELRRNAATLSRLGHAFAAARLYPRAVSCFRDAAALEPDVADHPYARAQALANMGDFSGAAEAAQICTRLDPQAARGFGLWAEAELMAGHPEPALRALEHARRLDPDMASYHANAAVALRLLGDISGATEASRQALRCDPTNASAHQNLANDLYDRGDLEGAIAHYDDALRHDPSKHAALAQKLHLQLRLCDWTAFDTFLPLADSFGIQGEPISPFAALAFEDHPMRHRERSARFARGFATPRQSLPIPATDRIRIGYVSSDFHAHATLQLLNGVLRHHDRARFEIHAYSLNPPSESDEAAQMRQHVDHHHPCHDLSDDQIAALARSHELTIGVDLKGYTEGARSRIFAQGIAPVQVGYLGYPGTVGADFLDYLIADRQVIVPQTRAAYAEAVAYLPHSYQPNDDQLLIAAQAGTRADHNLPEEAFVLCCFNQSYKISMEEFAIWLGQLLWHPSAVLWLMDPGPVAAGRLRQIAGQLGIGADRLIFAPRMAGPAHRARHVHADLFVDTFRVNAHTTASDALWAGLPVVTLRGQQFAARVAASLLNACDLSDLIADTPQAYTDLISGLISDPARLRALRSRVGAARGGPLFQTRAYTRHLEAAYLAMLDRVRAGDPPGDFDVLPDGSIRADQGAT